MEPTDKDIRNMKKIFKFIKKNKINPIKKYLVELANQEIDYNLKIFKMSREEFARIYHFCIDCAASLNENNECPKCGRNYGW